MKIIQIALLSILFTTAAITTPSASAEDCQLSACVDVYTQDGKIIIEGRKGGTTAVTPAPTKPTIKAIPKKVAPKKIAPPQVKKAVAPPKPKVTKKSAPKISTPTPQPPVTQSASLNDRLIKALPTAGIAYQPEYEPLVDVPVFMWTDLPTSFMTQVKIVGEIVDVALRPSFTWSFGDGTFLSTTDVGAPFPDGKIKHTYSNPGTYLITLISTWNGTYTHNAQTRAITGTVKTTSIVTITVVTSPTRFKN
ncbi:MAG: PKD domain-containing protein [Actinobacteria bacterium]|uniref:Unannotated protein n=1 Tax=freshwater metagenome TaxID=449393 RepID=A0A6J6JRL3_9ZZZZ|nr:PKD domain-containing protein [Actinomycetota bacterium]